MSETTVQILDSLKPRVFDIYILPGFMVVYAVKSKAMPKLARRMLFSAGLLMALRNYRNYKELLDMVRGNSV